MGSIETASAPHDMLWTEYTTDASETVTGVVDENDHLLSKQTVEYAKSSRESVNASDDQDVLIALVWMLPSGKRFFKAFPEVIFIDGTHKTNRENRPLFTMGLKDMDGRMNVVVRVWAPNERAWMFRWLLQTALPTLVGKQTCNRICMFITDGDSQEYTQLDAAIAVVFRSALRRRCGWHLIQGLDNAQILCGKDKEKKRILEAVKDWMYSLMKEIETKEEYMM